MSSFIRPSDSISQTSTPSTPNMNPSSTSTINPTNQHQHQHQNQNQNQSTSTGVGTGASSSLNPNPTTMFRQLVWNSTIAICVELDASSIYPGKPPVECYYTTLPRLSYLPLLMPTLRTNLVELALEPHLATMAVSTEQDWWFEYQGHPLRWHWPVGLLYDYHTSNQSTISTSASNNISSTSYFPNQSAAATAPSSSSSPSSSATSTTDIFRIKLRLQSPPLEKIGSTFGVSPIQVARTSFMSMLKEADFVRYGSTRRVGNLRKREQELLWEGVVDHEFEKFWSVASKIVPLPSSSSTSSSDQVASRAPSLNLSLSSSSERSNHMSSNDHSNLVEKGGGGGGGGGGVGGGEFSTISDNGNATVRRPSMMSSASSNGDGNALINGMPTPSANHSTTSLNPSIANENDFNAQPSTNSNLNSNSGANANKIRSVPVRIYLKDCPVVQEPISPVQEDGTSTKLIDILHSLFPLLFPSKPNSNPRERSTLSSFFQLEADSSKSTTFRNLNPSSNSNVNDANSNSNLAVPIIQGISVPLETEIGWIGATLANAEGWVAVVLKLT